MFIINAATGYFLAPMELMIRESDTIENNNNSLEAKMVAHFAGGDVREIIPAYAHKKKKAKKKKKKEIAG